jgi:hypothetical protein
VYICERRRRKPQCLGAEIHTKNNPVPFPVYELPPCSRRRPLNHSRSIHHPILLAAAVAAGILGSGTAEGRQQRRRWVDEEQNVRSCATSEEYHRIPVVMCGEMHTESCFDNAVVHAPRLPVEAAASA